MSGLSGVQNLIIIPTQKQLYLHTCSKEAHAVVETMVAFRLTQFTVQFLCVMKLSRAATTTGYCTTGKCIASLMVLISLFIT